MGNQRYDPIVQSLALAPPIGLSILVKLDDDNYLIKREHMFSYIPAYDLEGFIDGSVIKPSRFFNNVTLNQSFVR